MSLSIKKTGWNKCCRAQFTMNWPTSLGKGRAQLIRLSSVMAISDKVKMKRKKNILKKQPSHETLWAMFGSKTIQYDSTSTASKHFPHSYYTIDLSILYQRFSCIYTINVFYTRDSGVFILQLKLYLYYRYKCIHFIDKCAILLQLQLHSY